MPVWLKKKLFIRRTIRQALGRDAARAGAVPRSPRKPRGQRVLSQPLRRGGDSDAGRRRRVEHSRVRHRRRATSITLTHQLQFPHSLGLLYSAFTYYCGFKVNSGEYKLMGLAPYGRPVYAT